MKEGTFPTLESRITLLLFATWLTVTSAMADHIFGGKITWSAKPVPNSLNLTLTVDLRMGFRLASPELSAQPSQVGDHFSVQDLSLILLADNGMTILATKSEFETTAIDSATGLVEARATIVQDVPMGVYIAAVDSCCRAVSREFPLYLNNTERDQFKLRTTVNLTRSLSSPACNIPMFSLGLYFLFPDFFLPAKSMDGGLLRFRLASSDESGNSFDNPPGLAIDPGTGRVSWDTSRSYLYRYAASPAATSERPRFGGWTVQFVVESVDSTGAVKSSSPIDMIITLVEVPMVFRFDPEQTPIVNLSVPAGQRIEETLLAQQGAPSAPNVAILGAEMPVGASLTPSLPLVGAGGPISTVLNWTPQPCDMGLNMFTFYAQGTGLWTSLNGQRIGRLATFQATLLVNVQDIAVLTVEDTGPGSIRNALADARCLPSATIVFAPTAVGTIHLDSELVIDNNLRIVGPGADKLTISGDGACRVFRVTPGHRASIAGITIANGQSDGGSGVRNEGLHLVVYQCVFEGNKAPGDFGGAILNENLDPNSPSQLEVISSAFLGNEADLGAGIMNGHPFTSLFTGQAKLKIFSSTFSGNSGAGAAVFTAVDCASSLFNCTLSGNSTGPSSGILANERVQLTSPNVLLEGALFLQSTIMDRGTGSGSFISSAGPVSGGYNIATDDADGLLDQPTDKINTDAMLGVLKNNGGPVPSFALTPGSLAIDQGYASPFEYQQIYLQYSPFIDQRGFARTVDMAGVPNKTDGTDIGAFELADQPPIARCRDAIINAGPNCLGVLDPNQINDGSSDPDQGDALTFTVTPAGPYSLGEHTVTLTVTDSFGLSSSCTAKVTVKDGQPPTITGCSDKNVAVASSAGAVVNFATPTATDNCSTPIVTCNPPSGSTFPVGTTVVTCTAIDSANNQAQCQFKVNVSYSWSGFLQPINPDGTSVFKAGSTVPIKFQLTGPSAGIASVVAKLTYTKCDSSAGSVNEAVSTSAADDGNTFRYTGGQYIFNWSTKGLTAGGYILTIDLGDGVSRTIKIGLR